MKTKFKIRLSKLLLLLSIGLIPLYVRADYTATPVPTTTWGAWDAWGTSLAWFGTAFGNQYSVAEALFGTNQFNFNGTTLPGLGFNLARYNTGACGPSPVNGLNIDLVGFLPEYEVQGYWINPNSTNPASSSWDWTVDTNQRTLLLNAQALGANRFELFANSPMWWMCIDHCPAGNGSGSAIANLDPTNYDEFAIELATIAAYFKTNWGLTFTTVEPFNEPVSSWWTTNGTALQEGCNFPNASQSGVISDLRTELNNRGLNSMPISSPDDNQFDQTYNTWNSYSSTAKSQVDQINSHAYQGTGGNQAGVYSEATAAGKTLYVSEYGDNDTNGLTMASIITYEVSTLHPTGWTYWQALDADGKDKNWGMINASDSALTIGPVEPKYYVMAQYSRHIRQGMTIISSGDTNSLAAYDPVAQKVVIVTINQGAAQTITYNLSNFTNVSGPITSWTTVPATATYYVAKTNLPLAGKIFSSAFAANSVQTFEINLTSASIAITAASANPNPAYPGELVTISATVTDTNPVSTVTVDVSAIGGLTNQVLVSNGAGNYTNSITVGATNGLGAQTLNVNASDTVGNIASPFPFTLNIAPSIAITAASANPNPAYPGQSVTISATVTDTNPVSMVTVDASAIGGLTNQLLVSNGAGNYTNSITIGSSTAVGIHTLTVNAKDNLGNIALPFSFTLDVAAVTVTWTGATSANWSAAGNWSGVHTPPANGDTPAFGIQGPRGLALTNNFSGSTFMGVTFNAAAPAFILNGNIFTNTGELADNSLNVETLNLPVAFNGTQAVSAVGGGTLILNGVLSQQGISGLTKNGLGTVTLTGESSGVNTYAGATTINVGTLKLDFNTGGSTPAANIISNTSPLNLGGGTLLINGAAAGGTSQTFASTSLTAGGNVISLVNNGAAPTLALQVVTVSPGTTLDLSTNGAITTTTLGGAVMGVLGSGVGANSTAGYASYGFYDWATTDTTGDVAGTSPATIIGLSSVAGGYAANYFPGTGQGTNTDLTANYTVSGNTGTTTIRFNTPGANTININGKWLVVSGILVTPNMGANNTTIWSGNGATGVGQWFADYSSANAQNEYVWQNNIAGYFINNGTLANGRGQGPGTATLTYIQSGPGTVVMGTGTGSSSGFYSGQSYLNGGCTVVTADICLGVPATAALVVLNGGTVVGNATIALDNGGGTNPRPITLVGNGGGLTATAGNTITIDGVISGAAPLTIGIPASNANGNTVGLLPGSGAGTANTTAVNATGTVLLSTNDTCTGNTIIASGTLQLGSGGSINNSPNIIVNSGATYDVSLAGGYTLNAGQNLMGGGTVNGSVIANWGSGIYGAMDGSYGTNTFNNNLILATGAAAYFDVGTSSTGSNDEILVNGNLTLNGTAIHLKAPGTSAILASGNYTLFSSSNAITVNGNPTLVWDVPPTNSSWASITNTGNAVVLQIASPMMTPPMAAFTALTPTNIFVTQSVTFTNTSTGTITNSAWSFGDGNTTNLSGASTTNNVSNTYSNLGTNTVILTASGSGGSSAATNYVVVLPKPSLNQPFLSGVKFIFGGTNGPAGQTYRILTSTNVALALSNWTTVFTSTVNTDGSYSYTNTWATNTASFFRIISP